MFRIKITATILLTTLFAGCAQPSFESQFTSKKLTAHLNDGFRPGETLQVYEALDSRQRRGRLKETGDFYNYGPKPRQIEIVPPRETSVLRANVTLAPKRVTITAGCSKDKMTDRELCSMNLFPAGADSDGGLYQTVDERGELLEACIMRHSFPGRHGMIRVDSNAPFKTDASGCVSGRKARDLEHQLARGHTLLTRRVKWPYDYPQEKLMLIQGSLSAAKELFRWTGDRNIQELLLPQRPSGA